MKRILLPVFLTLAFGLFFSFDLIASDVTKSIGSCFGPGGIGSFDSQADLDNWYKGTQDMGSFSLDGTEKHAGASGLKVVVDSYSSWQVRMFNTACWLGLETAKAYQVEFWLKGEPGADMALTFQDSDIKDASLAFDVESADWKKYSFLMTSDVDRTNGQLRINFKSPGIYYIDELVILETDCNGVPGGTAEIDICGMCAGGDTGIEPGSLCDRTWITPDDPLIRYNGIVESEVNESEAVLKRFTESYILTGKAFGPSKARTQSGVSISFRTASPVVALYFDPLPDSDQRARNFAIFRNGELFQDGISSLDFEILNTDGGSYDYEVYLPIFSGVTFRGLELADGEVLELLTEEDKPAYVAIGNSITHGVGQNNGSHLTYPYHLADSLGYRLYNLGIGGSGINPDVVVNLRALPEAPELISVLWGYNNTMFSSNDLSVAMVDYDTLICRLAREFPKAEVLGILQTYTPSTVGNNNPDNSIERLRREQREILELRSLDFSNISIIDGWDLTDAEDLSDAVHLSDDGARNLAMGLISELGKEMVFAPLGAEWYYGEGFAFSGDISYMRFDIVGDSVLEGKSCRVLTKYGQLECNQRPSTELLYTEDRTVWLWEPSLEKFQVLYDFSARKGDSWAFDVAVEDPMEETYDSVVVTVDSVSYTIANDRQLLRLHVSYGIHYQEHYDEYPATIIERIGDPAYLFNWYPYFSLVCDGNYSKGLRCYEDEDIGLFSTGLAEACDQVIVNVTEEAEGSTPLLYPNPASEGFRIGSSAHQDYQVTIFSSTGRMVLRSNDIGWIDMEGFPSGLYFVGLVDLEGRYSIQKLMLKN